MKDATNMKQSVKFGIYFLERNDVSSTPIECSENLPKNYWCLVGFFLFLRSIKMKERTNEYFKRKVFPCVNYPSLNSSSKERLCPSLVWFFDSLVCGFLYDLFVHSNLINEISLSDVKNAAKAFKHKIHRFLLVLYEFSVF